MKTPTKSNHVLKSLSELSSELVGAKSATPEKIEQQQGPTLGARTFLSAAMFELGKPQEKPQDLEQKGVAADKNVRAPAVVPAKASPAVPRGHEHWGIND